MMGSASPGPGAATQSPALTRGAGRAMPRALGSGARTETFSEGRSEAQRRATASSFEQHRDSVRATVCGELPPKLLGDSAEISVGSVPG